MLGGDNDRTRYSRCDFLCLDYTPTIADSTVSYSLQFSTGWSDQVNTMFNFKFKNRIAKVKIYFLLIVAALIESKFIRLIL